MSRNDRLAVAMVGFGISLGFTTWFYALFYVAYWWGSLTGIYSVRMIIDIFSEQHFEFVFFTVMIPVMIGSFVSLLRCFKDD